ncbi:hypothetical protein MKW92_034604 [Papaver armeniacum]|nr:hypothetical protein MKW92_034604 [Papaver armeniacum]
MLLQHKGCEESDFRNWKNRKQICCSHRKESNEVFWMKDPKTGNWIPENHFNEVDVADLRNKLLTKK